MKTKRDKLKSEPHKQGFDFPSNIFLNHYFYPSELSLRTDFLMHPKYNFIFS